MIGVQYRGLIYVYNWVHGPCTNKTKHHVMCKGSQGVVEWCFNTDALDPDDPAINDDESLLSPDLQDPIWSPPPSHEAFTHHLNIPEPATESKLPQSKSTIEFNDDHTVPGPCPTTAEQSITSMSVQHSSEASSAPHNNNGHVSRAGHIRRYKL